MDFCHRHPYFQGRDRNGYAKDASETRLNYLITTQPFWFRPGTRILLTSDTSIAILGSK